MFPLDSTWTNGLIHIGEAGDWDAIAPNCDVAVMNDHKPQWTVWNPMWNNSCDSEMQCAIDM